MIQTIQFILKWHVLTTKMSKQNQLTFLLIFNNSFYLVLKQKKAKNSLDISVKYLVIFKTLNKLLETKTNPHSNNEIARIEKELDITINIITFIFILINFLNFLKQKKSIHNKLVSFENKNKTKKMKLTNFSTTKKNKQKLRISLKPATICISFQKCYLKFLNLQTVKP